MPYYILNIRFLFACFWISSIFYTTISIAQPSDSILITPNSKRILGLTTGGTLLYGVTLVGLSEAWYKNTEKTHFHFFNDNAEWMQVDKAGHFYTTYQMSRVGTEAFSWAGLPQKKAIWLGSLTGMLFQTPIELLDGFSSAYGASIGDVLANAGGAALNLQHLLWQETRIHPKFSFHPTRFAALRPGLLGANLPQQVLKDYNGQTYWLALDIQPWMGKESIFPKWLNLAIGYGAENMIFSRTKTNSLNGFDAYRQYYLSLDINLTRIPVKNKFVKRIFFLLNTLHLPAPAVEFNRQKGIVWHPVYF